MKVLQENVWLCPDCMDVVEGHEEAIYYHSDNEEKARRRVEEIDACVSEFGGVLVPDFDMEEVWYECSDCQHRARDGELPYREIREFSPGEEEPNCVDTELFCPKCGGDVRQRDRGYDEFSWKECDCCGSTLGGERHRYAVLGEG